MRKLATLIVESKEVKTPRDMEGYMIANNITYKTLPMYSELREKSKEEKVPLKAKIMAFHEEIREANRRGKTATEGDIILKREEEIYKVLQKHMTQKGSENTPLQSSIEEVATTVKKPVVHEDVEVTEEITETAVETVVEEEVVETVVEEEVVETVVETTSEIDEEVAETVVETEMGYITPENQDAVPSENQQISVGEIAEGVDIMETLAACFINELEGNVNDESMSVFDKVREENNVIYRKGKTQEDIELFVERTAKRKRTLEEKAEILATHFGRTLNQKKK